jgi:hypothetical protein
MISKIFILIKCKIKKHILVDAGSCPFTGKDYNACTRCGEMIVK